MAMIVENLISLSWELLTCARAACVFTCVSMTVYRKASTTKISTFYNYFKQSQKIYEIESGEHVHKLEVLDF